jgi:hypothetical protein
MERPDPAMPGQFAWGREGLIAEQLEAAGFTDHHVEAVDFAIGYRSAADWWNAGTTLSRFIADAVEQAGDDDLAAVGDAIDEHAAQFTQPDGTLLIPARTWVAWAEA